MPLITFWFQVLLCVFDRLFLDIYFSLFFYVALQRGWLLHEFSSMMFSLITNKMDQAQISSYFFLTIQVLESPTQVHNFLFLPHIHIMWFRQIIWHRHPKCFFDTYQGSMLMCFSEINNYLFYLVIKILMN